MSHIGNTIYEEAKREAEEETDLIQAACDADRYINQIADGEEPDRGKLTLLTAHEIAGLIAYSFMLYVWDRTFKPIADIEYKTFDEAKSFIRYFRKRGYHGMISPIVRKKADGLMAYHATTGKTWSF